MKSGNRIQNPENRRHIRNKVAFSILSHTYLDMNVILGWFPVFLSTFVMFLLCMARLMDLCWLKILAFVSMPWRVFQVDIIILLFMLLKLALFNLTLNLFNVLIFCRALHVSSLSPFTIILRWTLLSFYKTWLRPHKRVIHFIF